MKTTLSKIRKHSPCVYGWTKLLASLNKTKPDDDELFIEHIINSNGIDDAIWCLRAVDGNDRKIRLFAVWCARQVQHLMTDQRSIIALDVAERFANGLANADELAAAAADATYAADVAYAAANYIADRDAATNYIAARAARAARAAAYYATDAYSVAAYSDRATGDDNRENQKIELIRICREN